MSEPYRVVYADPPWQFGDRLPGTARGADKHYATMTTGELATMKMPPIADDALLFMWRVCALQLEALSVMGWWGFTQKSELVWRKLTVNGNRWFGMGRYTRMEHEVCLIGVRGRPTIKAKNIRSTFEAINHRHSEKPEEMYDIIEALSDGPYVELFARDVAKPRPNWTYLGDQT